MTAGPRQSGASATWALRWPERQLLLWCWLSIAIGFLLVLGNDLGTGRSGASASLLPLAVYGGSLLALHLTLVLARFRGDQILLGTAAFLAGFGLLAQYRLGMFADGAGPGLALYLFPAGVALMAATIIGFMQGRYQRLASATWVWAGLSLALLAGLLLTGQRFRGGVYAAGFITPTEILKITLVLFLAGFIDRNAKPLGDWGRGLPIPPLRALLPLAGLWAVLSALLLFQRDLGLFLILNVTLLAMLAMGTGRLGYLVYGVLAAAGLGYLTLLLFEHGQRRIQAWLDPFADPTGASWQILQGLSGMHSGGLWGEGFGQGNPEYTPIAESDFVYSVIGEELGFAGCALVVAFYLILFNRSLRIAYQSRSSYGMLVSAGLTVVLATQTLLNLGGVTKFLPLTGITLPFISHGGSSLLTGFISLGLILAVSEGGEPPRGRRVRTTPGRGPSGTGTAASAGRKTAAKPATRRRPPVKRT